MSEELSPRQKAFNAHFAWWKSANGVPEDDNTLIGVAASSWNAALAWLKGQIED